DVEHDIDAFPTWQVARDTDTPRPEPCLLDIFDPERPDTSGDDAPAGVDPTRVDLSGVEDETRDVAVLCRRDRRGGIEHAAGEHGAQSIGAEPHAGEGVENLRRRRTLHDALVAGQQQRRAHGITGQNEDRAAERSETFEPDAAGRLEAGLDGPAQTRAGRAARQAEFGGEAAHAAAGG